MNGETRVTVVMPVYNVAAYLDEAVRSVIAQSVRDWEMILVDDGSTDDSGRLCDAWAQRDERIRVIHKANGGLASARNAGLDAARGEWIMFPDSDDMWEDGMLETMLAASQDVDVVCCGLRMFPASAQDAWASYDAHYPTARQWAEDIRHVYYNSISACTKLYRRASICCRFDEALRHAEDLVFNLTYLPQARGIRFIPQRLYRYRWDDTQNTLGKRFWLDQVQISVRTWQMTRRIFADVPGALAFFDRRFVFEISKQFIRLARLEGLPEAQRLLVAQMYLSEPLLQEECFLKAAGTGEAARLWPLIRQGDAQDVFALCCREDLPGFEQAQAR